MNATDILFRLVETNYTSKVISIDGQVPRPCLFFDLLGSCLNGGHCVGFTGIGNCRCRQGFKGKFCASLDLGQMIVSNPGNSRLLNFVYMLVAVVLVSITVAFVAFLIKTCGADDSGNEDRFSEGDDDDDDDGVANQVAKRVANQVTPYQLPRVAITAASISPAFRHSVLGASFSNGKTKKRPSSSKSLNADRRHRTGKRLSTDKRYTTGKRPSTGKYLGTDKHLNTDRCHSTGRRCVTDKRQSTDKRPGTDKRHRQTDQSLSRDKFETLHY